MCNINFLHFSPLYIFKCSYFLAHFIIDLQFFILGCLQASEAIKLLVDKDIIQNIKIEHKNHQILIIEKNKLLNENNTDEQKNKKIKFDNFTDDQSSDLDNAINNSTKKVSKSKSIVPLIGRQILYDASYGEFHNFVLPAKNLKCEICSESSTIFDMVDSKRSMLDYEDKVKKVRQFFIFNWLKYA